MTDGIAQRIEHMIREIDDIAPREATVTQAMRAVARHHFVPPTALARPRGKTLRGIDRRTDPGSWWDAVYTDTVIVTQLDDGTTSITDVVRDDGTVDTGKVGDYSCSNSAPSTVADLLELLDPRPGHRVLEIGTGTGWTAALLSDLVGDDDNVTSIEIDPALAVQAAKNIDDSGHRPHLILGDGAAGHPDQAPYDRVHVTCGIRTVPYTWIEQTRPGGVIVAPYIPGFSHHALRLIVMPDGTAHGRFPRFASYMLMRSQRVAISDPPGDVEIHRTRTHVDPRAIAGAPPGADLAMAAITGLRTRTRSEGDTFTMWVFDPVNGGQWAAATYRPEAADFEVYQVGDRPVWEEVADAYSRWMSWGKPQRNRFGMTVTPTDQRIWLDTPEQIIS